MTADELARTYTAKQLAERYERALQTADKWYGRAGRAEQTLAEIARGLYTPDGARIEARKTLDKRSPS